MSICTSPQTHVEGIPNTISCILHNNNHFIRTYVIYIYIYMYMYVYALYAYMIALYVNTDNLFWKPLRQKWKTSHKRVTEIEPPCCYHLPARTVFFIYHYVYVIIYALLVSITLYCKLYTSSTHRLAIFVIFIDSVSHIPVYVHYK